MNNRYLFKAKDCMTNEWVIGSLIVMDWDSGYVFIAKSYEHASTMPVRELLCNHTHSVKKETICQYTGPKDKNGAKIFEGDIINSKWGKFVIIYNATFGGFVAADDGSGCGWEFLDEVGEIEVIGNIHDNPELLKGDADDE